MRERKHESAYCRGVFRVLTYNVHHCRGTDGRLSPARICDVIASCRPDIVALQELDVGRARTGSVDQAHAIAHELEMHLLFHPSVRVMEEQYGNAILTTRPAKLVKAGPLPGRVGLEPRGALWASVQVGGAHLQVITTHLGLRGPERLLQVEALLGPDWLGHPACRDPVLLLGDFNALPHSRVYKRLAAHMRDAQASVRFHRAAATFPSRLPLARIDHVFMGASVEAVRVEALRTPLARVASDHLPLLLEFRLAPVHERPTPKSSAVQPTRAEGIRSAP
jgi:endonuclease/exonuclease/phosphatase family metal-dependent hydrolase